MARARINPARGGYPGQHPDRPVPGRCDECGEPGGLVDAGTERDTGAPGVSCLHCERLALYPLAAAAGAAR